MYHFPRGRSPVALMAALGALLAAASASGAPGDDRLAARADASAHLQGLRLAEPLNRRSADLTTLGSKVDPSLRGAKGTQHVVVRLRGDSVGGMTDGSASSRSSRKFQLQADQDDFIRRHRSHTGMRVTAQTQMVLNAVFANVDAARIADLANDPEVARITPVGNYKLYLSETVPYIGAAAVQAEGFDGTGVRVAVLDSGIDYTHAEFGGAGTVAGYEAAHDDPVSSGGLFPTARVVGGYDFVGEEWSGAEDSPPLMPDEDPIDAPGGHGTHVADIIGGASGVAPGVDLYAVKVCSPVSTACSGVALIQGMEFAVDPNGDGDPSDAVDIINMSLGSDYGQPFDDDLSRAVDAATHLGVLTVAASGNGGNKPYITGTPAAAPTALSVAQTQVPSASLQLINVAGADYPAVFQPWSVPPTEVLSGPVQYGDGADGNLDGCAPFDPDSLNGLVVLVDRGACNFSAKIFNIAQAGGIVGIIGLVAPGAPFAGSFGGEGPQTIPGYMISQADADAIRAALPAQGTLDPANQLALVGQMVGSSSRGPQDESPELIKPEIGAPGASVSAVAGSGDGNEVFGGTSGASPMVAGSAALLLQAEPARGPLELKARLVNTANTDIDTDPFSGPAPITLIGGGEVRVDRALATRVGAWDAHTMQPALSFGFRDVADRIDVRRKLVRVHNYTRRPLWLSVKASFRFADDAENGAVQVHTLPKIFVPPYHDGYLPVWLTIHGEDLRDNAMSSGEEGANPDVLTLNEYDGYVALTGSGVSLHLPWHVLPRKDAYEVVPKVLDFNRRGLDQVSLVNAGVGTAQNDAYSLLALSPNLPEGRAGQGNPTPDLRAVGINTIPVPAGFCSDEPSFVWLFAANTWERQQHLLPVSHEFWLDTDQDGEDDYVVLNRDASGLGTISDGRQLAWAVDLATGEATAYFYAEHAMNTGNTVLYVCGEQVGLTGTDMLKTHVNMAVVAEDFYYGGPGDEIDGLTVTPLGERYFGEPEDVPAYSVGTMRVTDFGRFAGNTRELGVLLITNGDRGAGHRGGATHGSEARLVLTKQALRDLRRHQE